MTEIRIASFQIKAPDPAKIGVPEIATALVGCIEMCLVRDEGYIARNAADALVADLRNRGGLHLVDELLLNPRAEISAPNEELGAAIKVADDAQTIVAGRAAAEGPLLNRYRETVDRHRVEWGKQLAGRVPPALHKISTALKLMREAQSQLEENLDMLIGLAAGDYTAKNGGPDTYGVPLGFAIDTAAQALAVAAEQLKAVKPRKGATW